MAKNRNNNGDKDQPAAPGSQGAPTRSAIKPPGAVLGGGHGPDRPAEAFGPMGRLRAVLKLSGEVPEDRVLLEAATRIESLQSQVSEQENGFKVESKSAAAQLGR